MKRLVFILLLTASGSISNARSTAETADNAASSTTTSVSAADSTTTGQKPISNILFIAALGSKSHKNFYDAIIGAIVDGGHKVTILTPFKASKKHKNIEEVLFEENDVSRIMPNNFKDGFFASMMYFVKEAPAMCFKALTSHKTKSVLQKKYDLVFVSMFFSECFLNALHQMKVPIVFVNPAEMVGPMSAKRMGNPVFVSFNYNSLLNFEPPLTLPQRLVSVVMELAGDFLMFAANRKLDTTGHDLKVYLPGSPSIDEISTNASLMIVNSVRLAEHPRPYMPNILLVGGIHCKPSQPLPKDLDEWIASAGDAGIIYFSLGSAVRSGHLTDSSVDILLSVFKSLPQKVLWKHESTELQAKLPKNVRLIKWAPQQDLLGDPRLRVFITHGGIFSTQEAAYHGVLVVGLPVFGDQVGNMAVVEAQGWGRKLSWSTLTHDTLRTAITSLVGNKSALEFVRRRGALMRDALISPKDNVLWWTEYLIRTGGAPHLRSGALDLSWYQLYNLDVWLLLVCCAVLLLTVLMLVARAVLRAVLRCCGASNKQNNKKMKQKKN